MPNVLVLDANQRSALACTRSLGMGGLRVFTADETLKTLAGASKYSSKRFVYPSPHTRPREFVEAVAHLVREHDVDFLLPVTEVSLGNLGHHSHLIRPQTAFPFASSDAIELLSNKCALFRLAEDLGVPTPRTLYIDSPAEVEDLASELTFPLVIKPSRSAYHVDDTLK